MRAHPIKPLPIHDTLRTFWVLARRYYEGTRQSRTVTRALLRRLMILKTLVVCLAACSPDTAQEPVADAPIRGLIALKMEPRDSTIERRYPGVLEPSEITSLSFEVAGTLGRMALSVGQDVKQGQLLAFLDDAEFLNTIDDRRAAVDEATALLEQAEDTLSRQQQLFDRNVVSRVTVDNANTDVRSRKAQLTQAEKSLATAEEDLQDTKLYAPFDGIINAVEADSFTTVGVGTPVLSVYESGAYEVSFSVNFETVSQLVVGTPAMIRLADDPATTLDGVVSELGERADTVSSFPVIVSLIGDSPILRAGMAVEVSFEFDVSGPEGFFVPVSASTNDIVIPENQDARRPTQLGLFVFDPESSTVQRRVAVTEGIRDNKLLIVDGLKAGEWVAIKGVSFLRDGMEVRLIEGAE